MQEHDKRQKQLALQIVQSTTQEHRDVLKTWIGALLRLREADLPTVQKAKEAVRLTAQAKVVKPLIRSIAIDVKKYGWDERTTTQRFGIGAAASTIALVGPANAGIAALGGAVAVPLWVVFGSGAMLARFVYDNLDKNADRTQSEHRVHTDDE